MTAATKKPAKKAPAAKKPTSKPTPEVHKPAAPTPAPPAKPAKPANKVEWAPLPAKDFAAKVAGKKVHLLTGGVNPKRGKSAKRFGLYKEGMTVEAALEAGVLPLDLQWDASAHHAWRNPAGEVVHGAFIELK